MRFQLDRVSYAATFPTREMAGEVETLMRAAALIHRHADGDDDEARLRVPQPSAVAGPSPEQVRSSSAAAATVVDAIFAALPVDASDSPAAEQDELLSPGEAAALLGVSRPTLVSLGKSLVQQVTFLVGWLEHRLAEVPPQGLLERLPTANGARSPATPPCRPAPRGA